MSEPSVWWPTPVSVSRWFSEEERLASRRYHDPLQRAALVRVVVQLTGLVGLCVATRSTELRPWEVIVGVLVAMTVPRLLVDAWHEFVHERRFGTTPVSAAAFAVTSLARLALEGAVVAVVWFVLDRSSVGPSVVAGFAAAAAAVPLASALFGSRVVLALHRVVDVPAEHDAHGAVGSLASSHGLGRPRLVELDRASFEGANAYVTGQRSDVTIAVSHRLLEGPPELLTHVVGHEITHLRRRHLLWSALASALAAASTVAFAVALAARVADGSGRLAVFVLAFVVASWPFRLLLAWQSRAHERQADRGAMRDAPISPELVRALHLGDRPLLEPSRVARWQSSHPAPAERLEATARTLTSTSR